MNKSEAGRRIKQLRKAISYHSYHYHVLDDPEISDAAFDSLKHDLSKLEQQYPDLITVDSPTQRVSGEPLAEFKKVQHQKPMLSLEDIFSETELYQWRDRIKKIAQEKGLAEAFAKTKYFAELKIDGFAITLIYQNGQFVQGSTRGNGKIGEDVTQNLRTIESIPLNIKIHQGIGNEKIEERIRQLLQKGKIEIRGEVYMDKESFAKVNQERDQKGLPPYANPRNLAAGSIRQLDPKVAASRKLAFLAYGIATDLGQKEHHQEHQIAKALGFKTDQGKLLLKLEKVLDFREEIREKRKNLPYQIDGIVINVDDKKIFTELGVAGKAPRGAIALKFPGKEATTRIKDIIIQVGRTGILTPVAVLEPVKIDGVTITRATLHNIDEIKRLDVRINDTVIVARAGDVIPQVVRTIKEMRNGQEKKFRMPQKCPICGSPTYQKAGEVYYRCQNKNCGARHLKELIYFVSKKGFDIDGLGPKIIKQLMDEGLVSGFVDIFYLTKGDLLPLERFADKSAENLIEAINKSKKVSLTNFINALNIPYVGEETSLLLIKEIGKINRDIKNIDDFVKTIRNLSLEELRGIADIGPVVSQSINEWFKDERNLQLIRDLTKAGVEIKIQQTKTLTKLKERNFVFTGELKSLTRDQAKNEVRRLGGHISSSVSRNTDFVVAGDNPGSKYEQAQKLKVRIISEEEFLKIIK